MRRLTSILVTASAFLSLPVLLATLVLWGLSHRASGFVATVPFSPFTLSAQSGAVVLHRRHRAADFSDTVRQRIAYLRNTDLTGTVHTTPGLPRTFTLTLANRSTWANFPKLFTSTEYDAALLAALDDPDRFAAAHVALANRHANRARPNTAVVPVGTPGPPTIDLDGLRLELPAYATADLDELSQRQREAPMMPVTIDSSSQPRLLQLWNARLATPVVSIRCWQISLPLLLPTGLWVARAVHTRRTIARACRGLCPSCNYDLRATPTRCPECGAATR
jgi:hypothetical protein